MTYNIRTLGERKKTLDLFLRYQDILIWVLEFFRRSAHRRVSICCKASYQTLSIWLGTQFSQ